MTGLRVALSAAFAIAVAAGLVSLVLGETHGVAGRQGTGPGRRFLARPATWFGCAGLLFGAVVILTILFPVGG